MNNADCHKISIIIPIFNASNYLKECLDSVLIQTLKEIEIICVNDGSTDNSLEILKEYAEKDNRIKVVNQENKGAGFARNEGIKIAKGEFLAFLDSDDYYNDNTALERLYQTAINNRVLIAGGFRQHLKVDGQIINHPLHRCFFIKNNDNEKMFNYTDVQYDYHYHGYIFSKKIIDTYNLKFPAYKRFQDPPFFVKVMFYAKQFIVIPVEFYVFRESERGNCFFNSEKTCDLIRGLNDNLRFSYENNLAILHYVTAKRFLGEYFFTIAGNLSDVDSGIVKILVRAGSLLKPQLIEEAEMLLRTEGNGEWHEILNAMEIQSSELLPIDFISKVKVGFYNEIYRFNYNGASLLLDAVEDFMKGPDFFSSLDGEKVMKEKGRFNDKLDDIENFKDIFVDLGRVYDNPPMTKKERFIYQLTDNGHRFCPSFLLRKEYGVIPFNCYNIPSKQFLRKRLLAIDPLNKKYIVRKIDERKYRQLKKRYKQLMKQYDKCRNIK